MTQDLLWALRWFRKNPFFTAAVISILGIGIGVNTAVFSILDTVLLEPDERRLTEDYKHYTDVEKLQEKARTDSARLEKLFAEDSAEAVAAAAASVSAKPAAPARKDRAVS